MSYYMKQMTINQLAKYDFVRSLQETDRMEFIYSREKKPS